MVDLPFTESLDRLKESFLFAAAQGGNTEDCESLLDIGADPEWRNPEGDTSLLAATRRGHCETLQALLVHGANVNVSGKDSLTPLHVCCSGGDYKTLNILLQARPSLTARTAGGKTALEIAETKGFEDICSRLTTLLVSSGTDSTLWQQHEGERSTVSSRSGGRDRDRDRRSEFHAGGTEKRKKKSEQTSTLPALISADSSSSLPSSSSSSRKGSSSGGGSTHSSGSGSVGSSGSGSGYQLMRQSVIPGQDEHSSALRKQLDQEYRDKKALENKVAALQAHVTELRTENASSSMHVEELEENNRSLSGQLEVLKGSNLDSLTSVAACEHMEGKLKQALSAIDKKKEGEKSVVLFPCRHMCLCDACSQHEDLEQCPLCRRPIVQRISVYS